MKKAYNKPDALVELLDEEDILTGSFDVIENPDDDDIEEGDWF